MDGKVGWFDQIDDSFQSGLIRNRKCGVDAETKLCQAGNVSKVEVFEWATVRNVNLVHDRPRELKRKPVSVRYGYEYAHYLVVRQFTICSGRVKIPSDRALPR